MEPKPARLEVTRHVDTVAPASRVWAALTDPAQLARWLPDEVESGALRPDVRGWFIWIAHGRFAFAVEIVDAPHLLAWRWSRDAGRELESGPTTRVSWTLTQRPGGVTRVTVHETGFLTEEHRRENDGGWLHELEELAGLLR